MRVLQSDRDLAREGIVANFVAVFVAQAVTTLIALALDVLSFPEEAIAIVFVLGVMVTAVFTKGKEYSLVAAAIAVLAFNYFIVAPRYSMRAWGPDYPETFAVFFVVALTASYFVDELRKNEQEARKSEQAAMEARMVAEHEQMRANLLRSVSHDLRTPLTSISGNAEVLLESGSTLRPEVRERLTRDIRDDAQWLTDVVENLLAITRLEDATVKPALASEPIDEVVEEALRHVRRDQAGHQIVVVPPAEQLFAQMDASLVVQLVVNLVNNALAHTPADTTITIRCERRGQEAAIVVADDGFGIPDSDKERIFETFYTAGSIAADGRRGIGIGLALCQTIARMHGGRIEVTDVEPHGAAFAFVLPLEELPHDVRLDEEVSA